MYSTARAQLEERLPSVAWAKQLYISAKTGLRTANVFKAVDAAVEQHRRRVTTAVMNEVLEEGVRWQVAAIWGKVAVVANAAAWGGGAVVDIVLALLSRISLECTLSEVVPRAP